MSPIHTSELFRALEAVGLRCTNPHSEIVANVSEMSQELGWMFKDLPRDLKVPDPGGKADFGFFFQPGSAFEKRLLLLHDSKVLIFGHDGGGGILFVSELHQGRVGLLMNPPEDILSVNYAAPDQGIIFWNEEFLGWLQFFKKHGLGYIDNPGVKFE